MKSSFDRALSHLSHKSLLATSSPSQWSLFCVETKRCGSRSGECDECVTILTFFPAGSELAEEARTRVVGAHLS